VPIVPPNSTTNLSAVPHSVGHHSTRGAAQLRSAEEFEAVQRLLAKGYERLRDRARDRHSAKDSVGLALLEITNSGKGSACGSSLRD
jgi:hypothetical protein